MASEMEKPKKARFSQPQVRIIEPDETLQRYHVDLFNPATGKAKDARFEEIVFDLYKPGAKSIAFTTSEARIGLWIRCFIERYYKQLNHESEDYRVTWEEQDSASNANSCDRIILHLYALEGGKEQHLVAITVYISTGTIFIQGKWFQNYGMVEFPSLLDIINQMSANSNLNSDVTELCKTTLPKFLKQVSIPIPCTTVDKEKAHEETDDKDRKEATEENGGEVKETDVPDGTDTKDGNMETEHHSDFSKTLDDDIKNVEPQPLTYTPSRLHTLTALRTTVAKMESDYTEFKVDISQSLHAIETTMAESENQIKDRLCQLDNNLKLRIKNLEEEMIEMQSSKTKMMGEISKLASTVRKLQEQLTSTQKQNNNLSQQQEVMRMELESLKAASQQQSPCGQLPEESMTPQDTIFDQSPLDQQPSFVTPTVPLSNKYEILENRSEENLQDIEIKGTQEFDLQSTSSESENKRHSPTTHNGQNRHQSTKEENMRNPHLDDTSRPHERKPQTTPNMQNRQRTEKTNIVILCDSNGKYLNLKKLCPGRTTSYSRCHTIKQGIEIIESSHFDSPQIILLHTGTNDLERTISANQLTSEITDLIKTTAEKYPSSKILYSSLLPRRDVTNDEISKINTSIEKRCSRLPNVHLIDHANLMQQVVLHDLKHLNQHGVKLFAKNLKNAIHGRRQTTQQQPNGQETVRVNSNTRTYMAPLRQEYTQSRPSHATVFQRPLPNIMNPTVPPSSPQEHIQSLPSYATVLQRPPTQIIGSSESSPSPPTTSTNSGFQEQMDQQGQLMNISIPKKMLPLIQFFNNLI